MDCPLSILTNNKFLKWTCQHYTVPMNFLNGLVHLPFLELSIISFGDYQDENLKISGQICRAWSECLDMQAGLGYSGGKDQSDDFWFQRV